MTAGELYNFMIQHFLKN